MQGHRVVMSKPYDCHVETYEVPEPKAGEILIETEASAISAGTELAVYTGVHQWLNDPTRTWPRFPFTPGYSGVGHVAALGPQVSGYAVGDRVIWGARHESHAIVNVKGPDAIVQDQLIHKIGPDAPAKVMAFCAVGAVFPSRR